MKLTYRGISYERTSSAIATTSGKIIGKYRGAVLIARHPVRLMVVQNLADLKYRGKSYQVVASHSTFCV